MISLPWISETVEWFKVPRKEDATTSIYCDNLGLIEPGHKHLRQLEVSLSTEIDKDVTIPWVKLLAKVLSSSWNT